MAYVAQLDDDLQIGDLEAAADYLVVHDDVREVGVLGFCMGGMQVLKAAATGRFDRAVAFYGMIRVPEDWVGPHTRQPLDTAADVCPTLAIFGGGMRTRRRPTSRRSVPRGRTGPTARSSCTPRPTTGSCTRPSGRRTGPTTRPTRGGASLAFLLPD